MKKEWKHMHPAHSAGGGAVYGIGFIGALVYYLQQASSLGDGVFGVLKAIVWPALLVHKFLTLMHM